MKKRILIWSTSVFCAFFVASCGPKSGEQQKGLGAAELNKIIDQMVKDEELDQSFADNIKNKLKRKKQFQPLLLRFLMRIEKKQLK